MHVNKVFIFLTGKKFLSFWFKGEDIYTRCHHTQSLILDIY